MTAAQQIADQMLEIAERSGSRFALTEAHTFRGSHPLSGATDWGGATFQGDDRLIRRDRLVRGRSILHTMALARMGIELVASWGCADQGRAQIRDAISSSER